MVLGRAVAIVRVEGEFRWRGLGRKCDVKRASRGIGCLSWVREWVWRVLEARAMGFDKHVAPGGW